MKLSFAISALLFLLKTSICFSQSSENKDRKTHHLGIDGNLSSTTIHGKISPFKNGIGYKAGLTDLISINKYIDLGLTLSYNRYLNLDKSDSKLPNGKSINLYKNTIGVNYLTFRPLIQVYVLKHTKVQPFIMVGVYTGRIIKGTTHISVLEDPENLKYLTLNAINTKDYTRFNWGFEAGFGLKFHDRANRFYLVRATYDRTISAINTSYRLIDYPPIRPQALNLSLFVPIISFPK